MTRINILSPGRFHVLDLARELDKNGFDVKFYSYVPTKRAVKFGLPSKCNVSFLWLLFPFLILERITKRSSWSNNIRRWVQDMLSMLFMRKCDVLISMSGEFVHTNRKFKKEGGILIIERGSKHILEQRKVLESIPSLSGTKPVPDSNIKRELSDYDLADYISIASLHVKNSFLKNGFSVDKLQVNPYGVNLSMFKPMSDIKKEYDVIMVGGWSYRKGCDLISDAIKQSRIKFLHVGSIVDLPFPNDIPSMKHIDAVNQSQLVFYYNQAKIFILPSREEGLAMVQAQAIACNLPIVGSPDSGAEDLKNMVSNPNFITIINGYTVDSVIEGIKLGLENYKSQGDKFYAGDAIENLTWKAYGNRYAKFLNSIIK